MAGVTGRLNEVQWNDVERGLRPGSMYNLGKRLSVLSTDSTASLAQIEMLDNERIYFGTGTDVSMYFDATNLLVAGASARVGLVKLTNVELNVGAFSSTASGSGLAMNTTAYTAVGRFYGDDAGSAIYASGSVPDKRVVLGRFLMTADQSGGHIRPAGVMGHLKAYNAPWNTEQAAGVYGYVELSSNAAKTYGGYGLTAGAIACVETSGTLTVDTNAMIAGFAAVSKLTSALTQTGKTAAFYAGIYDTTNWSDSTSRSKWGYGLFINQDSCTRGVHVGVLGSNTTSGMPLGGATAINGFYADDSGAAQTASTVWRNVDVRTYFSIDQTNSAADAYSIRGQIKAASGVDFSGDTSVKACVMGYFECAGATAIGTGSFASSVMGEIWVDGNFTGTGLAAGVMSRIYSSTGTVSGKVAAFLACKQWASTQKWPVGLYNQKAAVTADIKVQAEDAASLPCMVFSGAATSDGAIVTDIGADALWADGSLYISVVDGAGKLFQKQNDVWVDLQA